jgi:hypothetical protein
MEHEQLGWVIYLTAYANDSDWSRFKQILDTRSCKQIEEFDAPEIAGALEWTFVDDQCTLDGASREQLRTRFRAWATEAINTENPRAIKAPQNPFCRISRYSYFIQADEESIRSVVDAVANDIFDPDWVNFVDPNWEPDLKDGIGSDTEAIDGYTGLNVGFMLIASDMVGADFYVHIKDMPEYWYVFCVRPPEFIVLLAAVKVELQGSIRVLVLTMRIRRRNVTNN